MTGYVALYRTGSDKLIGSSRAEVADGMIVGLELGDKVYTKQVTKEEADAIKASIVNRPLSPGVEAILNRNR
ncbi:hypothetical protein HON71_03725 [Candidatus Woesearchaeota archaeon]|jgi:hypothetical protein|nr:hypothetical protein [Candidatus Woesearchaeota archaeon]MBT5342876.1 hypothetical protein [Candidatus Woesearchaeota archaeon]